MKPTIVLHGKLYDFDVPKVMGIVNVTPDSFYSGSRTQASAPLRQRIREMVTEGVDILDIGGYSSRPGADDVSEEEEYSRLCLGLEAARDEAPHIPVSVDTFRSSIARRCVQEWGAQIINDISGGALDEAMADTVADLKCAYVLMHSRGTPATMQSMTEYEDVVAEVIGDIAFKLASLRKRGIADVIVDPGFGFAKTTQQNFTLLRRLKEFEVLGCPVLVGVSRKSMITRTLGISAEEALTGTTVLNTAALLNGASILRVHDVKEAKEAITLIAALQQSR